jgi:membrane fusion protein, multidrug efflux system
VQCSKILDASGGGRVRKNGTKFGVAGAVVAVALGVGMAYGRLHHAAAQSRNEKVSDGVPVTVDAASARDMPVYVRGIGTVQAYNNVTVKSRVDGQIVKVDFTEGQEVKIGDPLFEIDPRPFQAAVALANANEQKDEAQLASANADLKRDAALLTHGNQTQQAYDQQKAMVGQIEATIKADQALIQTAQLNLDYAVIRSPIDGRTGARQIDLGNLVHAADNSALVTITELKPIFVSFTAPQGQFDTIRQALANGAVEADAVSQGSQQKIAQGTLTLIDNQIDQTTGTIHLKAEFQNGDEALWPGEFVDIELVVKTLKNAVTVPPQTVQQGPNGNYLFVVKDNDTVEMRHVDVAEVEGGLAVIAKGLATGERVVVDGQYRLDQGTKVRIAAPSQPGSSNGA